MVAKTIIMQLGGSGRLKAMIGAKQFTAGANSLTFRFTAPSLNKANCVRVTLNAMDTYEVEFIRIMHDYLKAAGYSVSYWQQMD